MLKLLRQGRNAFMMVFRRGAGQRHRAQHSLEAATLRAYDEIKLHDRGDDVRLYRAVERIPIYALED